MANNTAGHSYYERGIGTRMRSIKWCHFQWLWTNPNAVFKVTPVFDAKCLTNGYRYGQSYYRPKQTNKQKHTHEIASYCPWRTSWIDKSLPYFAARNLATLGKGSQPWRGSGGNWNFPATFIYLIYWCISCSSFVYRIRPVAKRSVNPSRRWNV